VKNGLFESTDRSKVGINVQRVVISRETVDGSLLRESLLFYDSVRLARRRFVNGSSGTTICSIISKDD